MISKMFLSPEFVDFAYLDDFEQLVLPSQATHNVLFMLIVGTSQV